MTARLRSGTLRLAIFAAFCVLVGLGVWQLQRRAWKHELLARIAAAEAAPGVPLVDARVPAQFEKLRVTGRFAPATGLYGADVRTGRSGVPVLGAFQIAPLLRDSLPPLLVLRGWVDVARPPVPPAGPVTLEGYARTPDRPGWFTPADAPAQRRFYTLDPTAIGPALGFASVAPFVLTALGPPGDPDPAATLPRPPDDHLNYALTWFALAIALVVVSLAGMRRSRP